MRSVEHVVKPDAKWFQAKFALSGLTQRKVAKALGLVAPAISKVLRGKRKFTLEEATEVARLISEPLEVVLERLGISSEGAEGKATMRVSGWIDANFKIHLEKRGTVVAPRPARSSPKIQCLRFKTVHTPLEGMDGALVYFEPIRGVSSSNVGRMCVVKTEAGEVYFATPRPVSGTRDYSLLRMDGSVMEFRVKITCASPVVWMKL